jgi:hypothetical protein
MGVCIFDDQFDSVNMMKDIEIARHVVDKTKEKNCAIVDELEDECCNEKIGVPLLEWIEEDAESESFTLVQSRKKKKNQVKIKHETQESKNPLRRSKRTTPSLYRNMEGRKIFSRLLNINKL